MSNNKYKILVIEDESNIRSFVQTILESNGYQVLTASNGRSGQLQFASHRPDLVILDLGLPDMDGMSLIGAMRQTDATPIIVLSARTDESDKVLALDYGANDYITNPFSTAELLARVRATLRNSSRLAQNAASGGRFQLHDLEIDYDRRRVLVAGQDTHLTQTEYNIVVLLAAHAGKVLTYAMIIREVWGAADEGSLKKLQVNMANIRKKFGCRPGDNRYIINELGVGYRMRSEEE